jgi:hypothetical protein
LAKSRPYSGMISSVSSAPAAGSWNRGSRRRPGRGRLFLLAVTPFVLAAGPRGLAQGAGRAGDLLPVAVAEERAGDAVPAVAEAAVAADIARPVPAVFRDLHGLSPRLLATALDAVSCARARGVTPRPLRPFQPLKPPAADLLTVIDYSLPSTEPRLWVLDLAHGKVLFNELVAHGAGSGDNYATRFSNTLESRQSSLGLFVTGDTYEGGNGYSLRLRGLDPGVNDRAEQRNIVIHGAWYVSADHARRYGRLGRSWGCPALPLESARSVIDVIKSGTFVYSSSGRGDAPLPSLQASSPAACAVAASSKIAAR